MWWGRLVVEEHRVMMFDEICRLKDPSSENMFFDICVKSIRNQLGLRETNDGAYLYVV